MKKNLWPYAIIAYFCVFISGVVAWVVFAVHHEDQLVRADYYEQEIRFQQQIDRVARTQALETSVRVTYQPHDQTVRLSLPLGDCSGKIQFYRPSDARLDREFSIALDDGASQVINVSALEAGLWKVHLSWSRQGVEYYYDQPLVLATAAK